MDVVAAWSTKKKIKGYPVLNSYYLREGQGSFFSFIDWCREEEEHI